MIIRDEKGRWVIWEHELSNPIAVASKIKLFELVEVA